MPESSTPAAWDRETNEIRMLALPPSEIREIRSVIEADPAVVNVRALCGRHAGRFVFV